MHYLIGGDKKSMFMAVIHNMVILQELAATPVNPLNGLSSSGNRVSKSACRCLPTDQWVTTHVKSQVHPLQCSHPTFNSIADTPPPTPPPIISNNPMLPSQDIPSLVSLPTQSNPSSTSTMASLLSMSKLLGLTCMDVGTWCPSHRPSHPMSSWGNGLVVQSTVIKE
ncbi:hypothetical protein BKA82DRAFT_4015150 [Pisolithus tinctorius]|nr:hypothetical protein BKA82DRAFT_4015150 [Pisolithus tinctorius]